MAWSSSSSDSSDTDDPVVSHHSSSQHVKNINHRDRHGSTQSASTSTKLSHNDTHCYSKPHLYEQIGATSILYRHKPSYTSYSTALTDVHSTPSIPAGTFNTSKSIKNKNNSNSNKSDYINNPTHKKCKPSFLSKSNIDLDSIYPPQPWSRSVPVHSKEQTLSQLATDAKNCVEYIHNADRARVRWNLSHYNSKWSKEEEEDNNNDDNLNEAIDNQFDTNFNDTPLDKQHYRLQQKEYSSSPYILTNNTYRQDDYTLAKAYRIEKMHSSPMDGYCAPFARQAVRYAFGDERNVPLTRNELRKMALFNKKIKKLNEMDMMHPSIISKDDDDDDNNMSQTTKETNDSDDGYYSPNEENEEQSNKRSEDVPYTLEKKATRKKYNKKRKKLQHANVEKIHENIRYYGNCISIIPCICESCLATMQTQNDEKDNNQADPNMFILHPTGECISVSALTMPHGSQRVFQCNQDESASIRETFNLHVDVGGKILQIDNCFDVSQMDIDALSNKGFEWWFIVRTAHYCSIIVCKFHNVRGWKQNVDSMSDNNGQCSGMYDLKEINRLNMNQNGNDVIYNELLYMATKRERPTVFDMSLMYPTFAVVTGPITKGKNSYHPYYRVTNVINHVQLSDEKYARCNQHCIDNLKSVSRIEFSSHPMVLWSAAKSNVSPSLLMGKRNDRRPMIGYGDELYSIDLRCDKAQYLWGPSQHDFLMEGIQSISGIFVDSTKPYSLFANSISAGGRMFEVDVRMPCQTITIWSLPGLCDGFNSHLSPSSVYGSNALITNPIDVFESRKQTHAPVILCANQQPGAYGVQLYQRPSNLPRFQTQNLELPMTPGLGLRTSNEDESSCFATSSSFPISATTDPICGLAAFYTSSNSLFQNLDNQNYDKDPKLAMCVITASSLGDLFSQTLLVRHPSQESKSSILEGNQVGSCAITVPSKDVNEKLISSRDYQFVENGNLLWTLENSYPVNSRSILMHHVASRSQTRNFDTVKLRDIGRLNNSGNVKASKQKSSSIGHPLSDSFYSDVNPTKLQINSQYVEDAEDLIINGIRPTNVRNNDVSFEEDHGIDLNKNNIQYLKNMWSNEKVQK